MSAIQTYAVSVVIHLLVLVIGQWTLTAPAEYGMEAGTASLEVDLLAAPAASQPVSPPALQPQEQLPPQPLPPEPSPPEPPPQVKPEIEDMVKPEPAKEEPKPVVTPAPAAPAPPREVKERGDGSSATPGKDATTLRSRGGAITQAKPDYLRNPAPTYPEAARRAGQQGLVMLRVQVNARGTVDAVSVSESSGHSLLDQAAIKAVRKWKFRPATMGPMAVECEVEVPVRFKLDS